MDMARARPHLAHALRRLRAAGIHLSDRRSVKVQRLIASAAALAGRTAPTEADLWPLIFAVPTREEQATARDALADVLSRTENAALSAAAEEASAGPLARATRLVASGKETLGVRPAAGDAEAVESWRLKLEGIVREIDAGFAADDMPPALADVRAQIAAVVSDASVSN